MPSSRPSSLSPSKDEWDETGEESGDNEGLYRAAIAGDQVHNRITVSQTCVTTSFMSTPFNSYIPPDRPVYATPTSTPRSRGGASRRGRRPKAAVAGATESTKSPLSQEVAGPSTPTTLTWQSTMVPAPPTSTSGNGSGGMLSLPGATAMSSVVSSTAPAPLAPVDEDGEDELLPAMADDDYSAQLSWQSQSKDNLKCAASIYFMFRNSS